MVKMEIELTDEQFEKVKYLESTDISVGEAIDMLFEIKEKALPELDAFDKELTAFQKIKEDVMDVETKAENLDENYGEQSVTYDVKIQEMKHKISWARDFFQF